MLYVTGGIKTPSLQSLVSEQWAWFTNREERQRGRLIWSQRYRQDRSGSLLIRGYNKEEEEEGGYGGIEKWHLWSGDLTWGNTINTGKRRGCYMILVLYCSGDPEFEGESVTAGISKIKRSKGLIVSSTNRAWPCVSPVWGRVIRLVAQWDPTEGDEPIQNFPRFMGGSGHEERSSESTVYSAALLMQAQPRSPKAPPTNGATCTLVSGSCMSSV